MTAVEPDLADHPIADTAVDAARHFRDRGWRPFPLDHPDLPRCAGLHPPTRPCEGGEKRGKHPCVAYGTAAAARAPDRLLKYWFGDQPRNIGIACGPSGLLVVDEDAPNALAMLAADVGETLPVTYRVRTARGWHWYFEAPTHVELGNRSGRLAEYHIDVRGGRGKGGYVVAAGSTHHTGHIYQVEDPAVIPAPLPAWLIAEIQAPTGTGGPAGDQQGAPGAWDDAARFGTEHDLRAQYTRHLDAVRSRNGEFRHELFLAARDGYRLHALDLLDMDTMGADLKAAVHRVWGAEPDANDKAIVNDEARQAAARSPWALVGPTSAPAGSSPGAPLAGEGGFKFLDPDQTAEINAEAGAMEEAARFDADVAYRRRLNAINREAARLDTEHAHPTEPLAAGVLRWSAIATVKPPKMRVGGLVAQSAVTWLSGRSGSYKSFLGVAIGMSVATGTEVCGHRGWGVDAPLTVLYVAAEGPAGVSIRAQAYAAHHGLSGEVLEQRFILYPKRVDLRTENGRTAVRRFVEAENVGMIIYDTWHKVTPGLDDSSRQEVGEVMSFLDEMRDDHAVESIVVDHTGHAGERTTGSSSKVDDADCSLIIKMPGRERTSDVQRTLVVDKLKDVDTAGAWDLHLMPVPSVVDDEGRAARVLAVGPVPAESARDIHGDSDWRVVALPVDVRDYAGTGRESLSIVAQLVMTHGAGESGISRAEVLRRYRGAVAGLTLDASFARVQRAWDALYALDRLAPVNVNSGSKIGPHVWADKIV